MTLATQKSVVAATQSAAKKSAAKKSTTKNAAAKNAAAKAGHVKNAPKSSQAVKPESASIERAALRDVKLLQKTIVNALEDLKAQNIVVFDTEALSSLFERVIVASGTSNRQTRALASHVRDEVRKAGFAKPRLEGEDNGEWIIVDCAQAVVHVMQPAIRQYYSLEEIWGKRPLPLHGQIRPEKAAAPKASVAKKTALKTTSKTVSKTAAVSKVTAKAATKESDKAPAKAAAKPTAKPTAKTAAKAPVKAPAKVAAKIAVKTVAKPAAKTAKPTVKKPAAKSTAAKSTVAKSTVAETAAVKKPAAKKTAAK